MPMLVLENPEDYENFIRPVGMEIARSLFRLSGLDQGTKISYPDESGNNPNKSSLLDNSDELTKTNQFRRMRVEISEQFETDRQCNTPTHYRDARYIFVDPDLDVYIKPVYMPTTIEISCSYRAEDRVEAKRFQNYLLRKLVQGRRENLHEIQYHYPIPEKYLSILKNIWELREAVDGYGQEFKEYTDSCFSPKVGTISGLIGKKENDLLVVNEVQIGLQGWFDFVDAPSIEKGEDGSCWDVSFSYLVTLAKPISTIFRYPLMVHQRLIKNEYRTQEGPYRLTERRGLAHRIKYANDTVGIRPHPEYYDSVPWMKYPSFDDFAPTRERRYIQPIMTAMLSLQEDQSQPILDILDIKGFELNETIVGYMKRHHRQLHLWGSLPIHVAIYANDHPLETDLISVDSDLKVSLLKPVTLRRTYRLVISVMVDLGMLSETTSADLRNDGQACLAFLRVLAPELEGTKLWPTLVAGRVVKYQDWVAVLMHIRTTNQYFKSQRERGWFRVNTATIVAQKEMIR